MLWWVILACLAVALVSLPGHLLLDRLWSIAFGPPLAALFRNRRRSASLRVMWLDFVNMCATVFLALLSGLLILPGDTPRGFCWILVGLASLTSGVVVAIVSTNRQAKPAPPPGRPPATPMMVAGSFVAILLGIIVILARR